MVMPYWYWDMALEPADDKALRQIFVSLDVEIVKGQCGSFINAMLYLNAIS